jgi:hypothetical protein
MTIPDSRGVTLRKRGPMAGRHSKQQRRTLEYLGSALGGQMNVITLDRGALHRDEVAGAVHEVAHRWHRGMWSQLAEEASEEVSALC